MTTNEDQIERLTAAALNGNTEKNRHLALVQLLSILNKNYKDEDSIIVARDAAIKHAIGLTDTVASLLTNQPLPMRSDFDDQDVLPIETIFAEPKALTSDQVVDAGDIGTVDGSSFIPLYTKHAEDDNSPYDTSIESIAEHMGHNAEWKKALLDRLAQFGGYDLQDIKDRALHIMDDRDTYNKATRDQVTEALNNGNDLLALLALVVAAESSQPLPPTPKQGGGGPGISQTVNRQALSEGEIEHCVETLLAPGDDPLPRPYALLMLLDEIEHDKLGYAIGIAQRAILREPELADRLVALVTERFKPEWAHCDNPDWSIKSALGFFEADFFEQGRAQ